MPPHPNSKAPAKAFNEMILLINYEKEILARRPVIHDQISKFRRPDSALQVYLPS